MGPLLNRQSAIGNRQLQTAELQLQSAWIPPGAWAVGVSGGADSTALLALLRGRGDLDLHAVHLDHQLRGQASAQDAAFVSQLARSWGIACTVALRGPIEAGLAHLPRNPSARYRAIRMELFRRVVVEHGLSGVVLAHHADDQAETVLQRLIRGAGPGGLAGMSIDSRIGPLRVLRPMLAVRREDLRAYLRQIGQPWREDASNDSDQYLRNRLRRWLADRPELHPTLLGLAERCRALRDWAAQQAPQLEETFEAGRLAELPRLLARQSARNWLADRGAPHAELSEPVLDRLIVMASDAASPHRQDFPENLPVCRREGWISCRQPATRNPQPATK